MEPLKDQQALNAKKNRERNEQEQQEAEQEIDRLKNENKDLMSEAGRVKNELAIAKDALAALIKSQNC